MISSDQIKARIDKKCDAMFKCKGGFDGYQGFRHAMKLSETTLSVRDHPDNKKN